MKKPPLKEHVDTLRQLIHHDVEPDPSGKGGPRIIVGVVPDRRVSIEDKEMRHGRKSKSKRFNGYKRHIATDLDTALVLACAITPANRPEEDAAPDLATDLAHAGSEIDDLYIDRGSINAHLVDADNEFLQHRLRKLQQRSTGRALLRERIPVEHSLAHVSRRQGRRARYLGSRKHLLDLRRASAITNLEAIQRHEAAAFAVAIAA